MTESNVDLIKRAIFLLKRKEESALSENESLELSSIIAEMSQDLAGIANSLDQ